MEYKYYLIKTHEKLLAAVRERIATTEANRKAIAEFLSAYEATEYHKGIYGEVLGIYFKKNIPNGWAGPKRRGGPCTPYKSNTTVRDQMRMIPRIQNTTTVVQEITGVPLCVSYTTESGEGNSSLYNMLQPIHLLYLSAEGPYVMVLPDTAEALKQFYDEHDGFGPVTITSGADTWKLDETGLEEISEARWELMVAQHKVNQEEAEKEHV